MHAAIRNRTVQVWLVLVLATLIVWTIGVERGFAGANIARAGMVAVLAIAFMKVQLIGSFFMELRTAPLALRLLFSGWVVGVGGVVIAMYLLA